MRHLAVVVSFLLMFGSVTGCAVFGSSGTPSKSAVSVSTKQVKAETLKPLEATASELKNAIDLDTGYGAISNLSNDNANAWRQVTQDAVLATVVQSFISKSK